MAYRTRRPTRMGGAVIQSGNIDTGEVTTTRGGQRIATFYSGIIAGPSRAASVDAFAAGSDVGIYSGAGRVNYIMVHFQNYTLSGNMGSGQCVSLYDGGTAGAGGSGGPIQASGHRVLCVIQGTQQSGGVVGVSGAFGPPTHIPIIVEAPFTSGLYISTRSGMYGVSVAYTPEAVRSGQGDDIV